MRVVRLGLLAGLMLMGFTVAGDAQTQQRYDRLAIATTPGAGPVQCQATKMFSCGAQGCETDDFPDGLPVQMELKTAEGKGYLCTFSYCRSFTLMGWRGRPRASGLTWSSATGSTPPGDKIPGYDFTLTLADNGESFTLVGVGDGKATGYSGDCGPSTGAQ